MVEVRIRIQHREGRDEPLARLLENLTPVLDSVEVITDTGEPPNPWRGFRRCLTAPPDGVSHLVVLQDDTVPCGNFLPAAELITGCYPNNVVCLFVPGAARRTVHEMALAMKRGKHYVEINGNAFSERFVPVVATIWPVGKAQEFLSWAEANPLRLGRTNPRSDDAVTARWARFTNQTIVVTAPSIVEHPDDFASSITTRARGGLDKGRVAAFFIDGDPLDFDWS